MSAAEVEGLEVAPGRAPRLRYVQIQTHSRCNADCVFCPYVESWHAEHPGVMSDPLWEKVLCDLKPFEAGISRGMIAPYLMNEPLLDPRIFQRIEDIYAAFPRTMVQIATNGAALTPRNIDRLLAALDGRKHQIWVSHHGLDGASMQEIMRLDHDRALRNLLRLLEAAEGRFRILIRGAGQQRGREARWFTPERYRSWWAELLDARGLASPRVHVDAFTFHDRAGGLRRADRGAGALSAGTVRRIDPHNPFWCGRIDEWLHVLWDGRIRICCMDYHGEIALPSVAEISIEDYLGSSAWRGLAERVSGEVGGTEGFLCERCVSPGG